MAAQAEHDHELWGYATKIMHVYTSSWLVVSVERRLSSRTSNSGATPKQITQTQTRAVSGHYDRATGGGVSLCGAKLDKA